MTSEHGSLADLPDGIPQMKSNPFTKIDVKKLTLIVKIQICLQ